MSIIAPRFVKLDPAGAELPPEATAWVAVKDTRTHLIWSPEESKSMSWKKALAFPASLTLCGAADWRLPTCDELLSLVDRTRHSPAIDTDFFPACRNGWYWTSTPAAFSPGVYAWYVSFGNGSAGWLSQGYGGFVRAVRASQT